MSLQEDRIFVVKTNTLLSAKPKWNIFDILMRGEV